MKKNNIIILFFLVIILLGCDGYNKLVKSSNYELKLEKAQGYYDKKNYVKAMGLYEELIPVYKGTDKAEEIYYYFTYCNFYQGDYGLSQYHFKNYTRSFPNGKHAEECLFMNAYCYYLNSPAYHLDQTDTKNAMAEMQNFIDQYPESSRIDSCNKISDLLRGKLENKERDIFNQYFKISDYKAAIASSINFGKEFPESKYVDESIFVTVESYYLLAINSLESKKLERLNLSIENHLKLLDLFPKSEFAKKSEDVYQNCLKLKTDIKKQQ